MWVGYPEGQIEMKTSCFVELCRPTRIQVTGGSWPADIWNRFMLAALAGVPASSFTNPGGVVTYTVDTRTGCLATDKTPEEFVGEAQYATGDAPASDCGKDLKVPDVFGFPEADAIAIMEDAGFEVNVVKVSSNQYPPGRVVGQSPAAGETASAGSTITLEVSGGGGGDGSATVPSVLGLSREEAENRLTEAGYRYATVIQAEGDKKQAKKRKGQVWKQSPASGTNAENGSTVTIWVNPG